MALHPTGRVSSGQGVVVLLNANAGKVTAETVAALRQGLPDAQVKLSRSLDAAAAQVKRLALQQPRLLLSGGGDGAVTALINFWRETGRSLPPLGLLPLGTGNAWAHATGTPALRHLLARLPRLDWPLPTRRFNLLEVEGRLCPFAGAGWDTQLLTAYHRHAGGRTAKLLPKALRRGLGGYLTGAARFAIPKALIQFRPRAELITAQPYRTLDRNGGLHRRSPGRLCKGPFSVLGLSTTTQYGFRFEAFPFATAVPDHFNLRFYDRPLALALVDIPRIWRGSPRVRGMRDFFLREVKVAFDEPVPFQIAGDLVGERTEVEARLASETVDVVDWHLLER